MTLAELIVWAAILGTIGNAVYAPTQINKPRPSLDAATGWALSVLYVGYVCALIYIMTQLPS